MSLGAGLRNITAFGALTADAALVALAVVVGGAWPAGAQDGAYSPEFTSDTKPKNPEGKIWREWPFIGTPRTPNALNDGQPSFPEFQFVYIDPLNWEHHKKTGQFREGAVLAKELTGVRAPRGPII